MRIITIEEHVRLESLGEALRKYSTGDAPYGHLAEPEGLPYYTTRKQYQADEDRIANMDANGIDMQVLSCPSQAQIIPKEEAAIVSDANDELAQIIAKHPDRYSGFALLPWSNPEAAVKEAERAVNKLGFRAFLLAGRAYGNNFLDDPQATPILEALSALETPLYVHPAPPMLHVQQSYYAGFDDLLSARLSFFGWGWHHEAGIQILRTILSGALDRFPNLKLIAGHWGEMVPNFLTRLDQALPQSVTKLNRSITQAFRDQIYVTPSGIFDELQLQFAIQMLGSNRIIHAVDYPHVPNEGARSFIENASISAEDKERIAHSNVEKLLKMTV